MTDRDSLGRWSTHPRGGLVLFALTFLLYANSFRAFFVGDDFEYLLMFALRDLGETLRFSFWGEWEPLWYLSWFLDQRIWGIEPLGYHLTNTLFLALAVAALFSFVRMVWPGAPWVAWTAAVLFLTHPAHDEAVVYLSARGHPMALGLAMLALCLYVAFRRGEPRRILLAASVASLYFAALAKELALVVPVWIGATEWLLLRTDRSPLRRFVTGLAAGAGFLLAAASTLILHTFVDKPGERKLLDPVDFLEKTLDYLPSYTLVGGAPLPYALLDSPVVERAATLGWALLAVVVGVGIACLVKAALDRVHAPPAPALFGLGLLIAASGLLPVLLIDVGLRRRYLFTPSIGIALIAAVALHQVWTRWRRPAWALLILLALLGAGGTVYRNELYRRAGNLARDAIEAVRERPLDQWVGWPPNAAPRFAFLTLPERYGGDSFSGAYVFHRTDLKSALRLFGVEQEKIVHALKIYHAGDYTARAAFIDGHELELTVSFRTDRAYSEALRRDPDRQRRGRTVQAEVLSEDPTAKRITYRVRIAEGFWDDPRNQLWLYSDEKLTRLEGVRSRFLSPVGE